MSLFHRFAHQDLHGVELSRAGGPLLVTHGRRPQGAMSDQGRDVDGQLDLRDAVEIFA